MTRHPVTFVNISVLQPHNRERVRSLFLSRLSESGITATDFPSGQVFAIMQRGRAVGGAWVRTWPTQPHLGDVHIMVSPWRLRDFPTVRAFDVFLMERQQIMGVKGWRVMIAQSNIAVLRDLQFLQFNVVSQQALPVVGPVFILEREVI